MRQTASINGQHKCFLFVERFKEIIHLEQNSQIILSVLCNKIMHRLITLWVNAVGKIRDDAAGMKMGQSFLALFSQFNH